jgi:hypothetical protein
VIVDVCVVVTRAGVVLMVRVWTVDGSVVVMGFNVAVSTLVNVVVVVDVGVSVTLKVAVGVMVTTFGGPAMIENVRIQANVRPSMTTVQSPEII